MTTRLRLRPITQREAKRYIGVWHRHNDAPRGGVVCASVVDEDGKIHGVMIAGRPVARAEDDGLTLEVLRVATDGTPNACSMLYASACRVARALGYTSVITYTLASEPGTSLRASGFVRDAELAPRVSWSTPSRPRQESTDLFGHARRPTGPKVRWLVVL